MALFNAPRPVRQSGELPVEHKAGALSLASKDGVLSTAALPPALALWPPQLLQAAAGSQLRMLAPARGESLQRAPLSCPVVLSCGHMLIYSLLRPPCADGCAAGGRQPARSKQSTTVPCPLYHSSRNACRKAVVHAPAK